jgi:dipeptidyl aminopeptidase
VAVAPVTDWRFCNSVYTERYMNTPEVNKDGYDRTAVTNVTNFAGLNLLLAHGTGDDNVHFANMASLVDKLTQEARARLAHAHLHRLGPRHLDSRR